MKILFSFLFVITFYSSFAQHIQYRDKKKPVAIKTDGGSGSAPIPVPDNTVKVIPPKPVVIKQDTGRSIKKSRAALTMNPRPKKPYVEEQNMCDLMSKPEVAPTLPLVINKVAPEFVAMLKARYKGRLYSITGLNMKDERLKYKLKVCDRNLGRFRSEYLDKDGKVVTDPDFDYE
jgi:hypothetical protein